MCNLSGYTLVVIPVHPVLQQLLDLSEALSVAAKTGVRRLDSSLHRHREGYKCRRPGFESPMWNVCATLLHRALRPYGAKARMARYLGIPRQRLNNFLHRKDRLPDAEVTLRMLHWLILRRAGRDPLL